MCSLLTTKICTSLVNKARATKYYSLNTSTFETQSVLCKE